MKRLIALLASLLVVGLTQAEARAPFCYDNTDKLVVKLKKVQLTTEQLKDIFQYQQEHRDLIAASHADGRGCTVHEHAELDFEKRSIGVLDDTQFKQLKGRVREEAEQLRYENYLLKKEVERMQQEMAALRAQMDALQAASR